MKINPRTWVERDDTNGSYRNTFVESPPHVGRVSIVNLKGFTSNHFYRTYSEKSSETIAIGMTEWRNELSSRRSRVHGQIDINVKRKRPRFFCRRIDVSGLQVQKTLQVDFWARLKVEFHGEHREEIFPRFSWLFISSSLLFHKRDIGFIKKSRKGMKNKLPRFEHGHFFSVDLLYIAQEYDQCKFYLLNCSPLTT